MSAVLDHADLAVEANHQLEGATALEIMGWAYERFGSGLVVTSSMADTVMIHLAEQAAPGVDALFLDTGYHFVETIGTRDAVRLVHNVNVINVTPEHTVAEQDALWGKDLFARNPDTVDYVVDRTPVGNLYVNREITGAMVGRQPFGGGRLSGTGPKAGGPDYLLQFVEARAVSENTVRHGLVV